MDLPDRDLVEQIPALVYIDSNDLDPKTLYVSPQVVAMLGHDPEDYRSDPGLCDKAVHPDDLERVLSRWEVAFRTGEAYHDEYRIVRPDGGIVWVIDDSRLIRDPHGEPRYWLGVLMDISERKALGERLRVANEELELRVVQRTAELIETNELMAMEVRERIHAEEELRQAREDFRLLLEDLPAVVYRWHAGALDGEPSLSYTSPQIEALLGFTSEEWDSATLWIERLHPHDRDRALAASDRSQATGEPYDMEFRYLAKDGRVVWVHSHATLLKRDRDGNPLLFQGVMVDITDRKEAGADVTSLKTSTVHPPGVAPKQ